MELAEARGVLGAIGGGAIPLQQLNADVAAALQRALATLRLLHPLDDVDGQIGNRTKGAWKVFLDAQNLANPGTLDGFSAGVLLQATHDPAGLLGLPKVALQPEFEFRRRQRQTNRDVSVQAIRQAGLARQLTKPQIAYILATAEHESDAFSTLEEYSSGSQYEGRADLGNTQPGDGQRFVGRGYVQLTGRRNYTKYAELTGIDLIRYPSVLMNWPALSVFVIVDGMVRGVYTTRRLDEFVNTGKQDFFNARLIVNGHDRAQKIADQASDWLRRL